MRKGKHEMQYYDMNGIGLPSNLIDNNDTNLIR